LDARRGLAYKMDRGSRDQDDMRGQFISAVCGLFAAFAPPVMAEPLVVVELFTSQGCASCPPADEFFETLVGDKRIMPLSLHVDYWDYIGWEDSFADPAFTERQKSYARASGSKMIYTPQMIVGGEERIEGYAPDELALHLGDHLARVSPVTLTVTRQGDKLVIHADADPPLTAPVMVQLVRYRDKETVQIERGENAGMSVTYRNIVTSWDDLDDWAGTAPLEMTTAMTGDDPAVVIVQEMGPAKILAAARAD
jgi:hypothetical protein